MRKTFILSALTLALSLAAGCSSAGGEDDPLGDTIDDGKADSFRSPTNHYDYFMGTRVDAQIGGSARYHAWQFALDGAATVDIESYNSDFESPSDTVVYLYKKGSGSTWNRLDTAAGEDGSDPSLTRDLKKGTYRIIVKGKTKDTEEATQMSASCEGDGCPHVGDGCLFGAGGLGKLPDSYVTIPQQENTFFKLADFASAAPENMNATQIVDAYAMATDTDQPSLADVFGDIVGGTVVARRMSDSSLSQYLLYTFDTKGGKKVSGIFHTDETDHGAGALMLGSSMSRCFERAPVCAFGREVDAIDDLFTTTATTTYTSTRGMTDLEKAQLVKAANHAPNGGSFTKATDVFGSWDEVTVTEFQDPQTGASYTMYGFLYHMRGIGEESAPRVHGLIFEQGSTQVAAQIHGNHVERCGVTRRGPRRVH